MSRQGRNMQQLQMLRPYITHLKTLHEVVGSNPPNIEINQG